MGMAARLTHSWVVVGGGGVDPSVARVGRASQPYYWGSNVGGRATNSQLGCGCASHLHCLGS